MSWDDLTYGDGSPILTGVHKKSGTISWEYARLTHSVCRMYFSKLNAKEKIALVKDKTVCIDHTKEKNPMAIFEFDDEEDFDQSEEAIETINFEHLRMREEVEEAKKHVEYCEEMLQQFEEYYSEYLID